MLNTATTLFNEGKKSLNTLLREKAYSDVAENLSDKGIEIKDVNDTDIETLVADREKEIQNGIEDFTKGGLVTLALSLMLGA